MKTQVLWSLTNADEFSKFYIMCQEQIGLRPSQKTIKNGEKKPDLKEKIAQARKET